jgi:hypothetical protein
MITFLFWNVGASSRAAQISDLATTYEVDVLLLTEVGDDLSELGNALNRNESTYHYAPGVGNTRLHVFVKFAGLFAKAIHERDRVTVRRINPPDVEENLVALVHLPSKSDWSEDSQAMECMRVTQDIERAVRSRPLERRQG